MEVEERRVGDEMRDQKKERRRWNRKLQPCDPWQVSGVTIVTRGLSRFSQDGICPLVTMKMFRTHGACLSIDRAVPQLFIIFKTAGRNIFILLRLRKAWGTEKYKISLSHTYSS